MQHDPNARAGLLAARIALTYALVATVWIVVSDWAVDHIGLGAFPHIQTYKGLAFVAVTAGALFLTVRAHSAHTFRAAREVVETRSAVDRIYRFLGDVSSLLMRTDDEHELYQGVCRAVVEAGAFDGAWVMEPSSDRTRATVVAVCAGGSSKLSESMREELECEPDGCMVHSMFETGEMCVDNQVTVERAGPCARTLAEGGVRAMAALPIKSRGVSVASFCVFSTRAGVFTDAEITLLRRIEGDLSLGVEKLRDAEETRRIQQRLESSEQRYRRLFESNPRPMWVYDLETLAFLDVNDAAIRHYGYSRDEFLTMTIADIRPAEELPMLLENVGAVTEGLDEAGLWRHVTKDGRTILVEITSHVLEFEGRKAELVLADDVTALVEATTALRHTAARLSALVETAPVAIIVVDREGRVTEWNPAAERIFGWGAEEVLGELLPIVPPDSGESMLSRLDESFTNKESRRFEGRRLTKSGALIDVVVHTAPHVADGDGDGPDEIVGIILDVTEEKRAELELRLYREHLEELVGARTRELAIVNERLRLATRVKSEFLANMSHELRTPLNSIIGFSGILLQGLTGELTEEQQKQVGMVHRSGKHLLELINDVLDLSRIEAGRVSIEPVLLEIRALVGSVVDDLQPLAEAKGLEVTEESDEEIKVYTDRTKVRQILYNLVGNAIKFTESGGATISFKERGDYVEFTISDTGSGIAADDVDVIFDEFYQARLPVAEKPAGTGLGLAISRKLARMLGGDITVRSTLGEGSVFTFWVLREARAAHGEGDRSSTRVSEE